MGWDVCNFCSAARVKLPASALLHAVADAGSVTVAAEQKLHTSQPSLSRQIRDLEQEVGVPLINRSVHGVELTSAGKAFLDHARMALVQAEAAKEAALRAAQSARPTFALGFLSGTEIGLLPEVTRVLRNELPGIEIRLSSDYSPSLARALMKGRLDAAFMRLEEQMGDLRLQARPYGSAGFRISERPSTCVASGHRATRDRE